MYILVNYLINMSNQHIIDLLTSKFGNVEKNLGEIGVQLVQHREGMIKIERELTTRVQANTIELKATTEVAASNSVKVDNAKAEIVDLKNENDELKKKLKKVEACQLDSLRRSYKK